MSEDARDGRETGSAAANDDLSARLKRLEARIDQGRPAPGRPAPSGRADSSQLARAFRMSAEFVAGIVAGGLLGWSFDHYLGTKPWGMIVLLMLGFCAGIYNVMRVSGFAGPPGRT